MNISSIDIENALKFFKDFDDLECALKLSVSEGKDIPCVENADFDAKELIFKINKYTQTYIKELWRNKLRTKNKRGPKICNAESNTDSQIQQNSFLAFALYGLKEKSDDGAIYHPLLAMQIDWRRLRSIFKGKLIVSLEDNVFVINSINFITKDKLSQFDSTNETPPLYGLKNLISNKMTLNEIYKSFAELFGLENHIDNDILQLDCVQNGFGFFFIYERIFPLTREFEKAKREIDETNKSGRLTNYYILKESTQKPTLKEFVTFGSNTQTYKLSAGQFEALKRTADKDEKIVAVIGAPGTGKSTLITSVIANYITQRALNIIDNNDKSNVILLTSTTHKAVTSVVDAMDKLNSTFKESDSLINYIYFGSGKKKKTIDKINKKINQIKNVVFDKTEYESLKKSILDIKANIENLYEQFIKIKKLKVKLDSLVLNNKADLKAILVSISKFNERENEKILAHKRSVDRELSNYEIKDFDNSFLADIEFVLDKIEKMSFLDKIFRKDRAEIAKLGIKNARTKKDLKTICLNLEEFFSHKEEWKVAQSLKEICKNKVFLNELYKNEFCDELLTNDNFTEFERNVLFQKNGELFYLSAQFLNKHAIFCKEKVVQALGYLLACTDGIGAKWRQENNKQKIEDRKELLQYASLVFSVHCGVLASVHLPKIIASDMDTNINSDFFGIVPFDLAIVDEAAMVRPHNLIGVIRRSKKMLIVGDPKQLKPIISIPKKYTELFINIKNNDKNFDEDFIQKLSPLTTSAFHRGAGTLKGGFDEKGDASVLDEHRRCDKQIAQLFKKLAAYEPLEIKTPSGEPKLKERLLGIRVICSDKTKNQNKDEIEVIKRLLDKLEKYYNLTSQVGIITPYKLQEQLLQKEFAKRLKHTDTHKKIGTVHSFQGSEFEVIIFSSVVSKDSSLNFINQDISMLNVAISRAKEHFIVVGDEKALLNAKIDAPSVIMANGLKWVDDLEEVNKF